MIHQSHYGRFSIFSQRFVQLFFFFYHIYNVIGRSLIKDIHFIMKISIALFLLIALAYCGPKVCQDCQSAAPACNFQCLGKKCEAYTFNMNCSSSSCFDTFYRSFSYDTMNRTLCIACNYTVPGCMICGSTGQCAVCQPDYIQLGGGCYHRDGSPVGSTGYMEGIWIAFVVLFSVFGIYFAVMRFLQFKNGQSGRGNPLMGNQST